MLIIIFKAKCLLNISLACAEKRKLGGGAGRMNHHLISASSLAQCCVLHVFPLLDMGYVTPMCSRPLGELQANIRSRIVRRLCCIDFSISVRKNQVICY